MAYIHYPATATLADRLRVRVAGAMARWREAQARARSARHLLDLDDHLLRDIGLEPNQVHAGGWRLVGRPL